MGSLFFLELHTVGRRCGEKFGGRAMPAPTFAIGRIRRGDHHPRVVSLALRAIHLLVARFPVILSDPEGNEGESKNLRSIDRAKITTR